MKKILCLSVIFLLVISCAKKNESAPINSSTILDTDKTYLALGDSYTIGESVAASETFPFKVGEFLRQQNVDIKNPDIIAKTGWTTANLIDALNFNPPKKTYSFVTLLIGVNNQYQGRSLNEYKTEFTELLSKAISYAGNNRKHVFVISIPDYSVTPFAQSYGTAKIAREIANFNEANKAITLNEKVTYIDVTPISRDAKNDPSLIAGDGLHPSALQYKKWSELLAPVILQEIQ